MFLTCLILVKPRIWPKFKWAQNSKNQKKWKTKSHSLLMSYSKNIQVDKLGLDIFNQINHVSTPNPKLYLVKSSMKRSGIGFQTWKFQNTPTSFILEWLRRIATCLLFLIHVLNLFQSWSNLGFDQNSNGHKNSKIKSKKWKTKAHSLLMSYSKHSSW
jgi:hypothetical protein